MITKIVLATHGHFASGIKSSLEMISGEQPDILCIDAYTKEDIQYSDVIEDVIKNHNYDEERLLVFTDLLGGSVNNEFMKHINDYSFELISGLNLGTLLEIVMAKDDLESSKLKNIVSNSSSYIVVCNEALEIEDSDCDF